MTSISHDQPLTVRVTGVILLLCVLWGGMMVSVKIALTGVALSWLIFDDQITIHLLGGLALLAAGLYVINRN